ncbi:hypothetical protein DLJ82_5692 (plasmid) [Rhizobium leguminosarum]|uniref:Uncharacterized protein n=1 Tax=Rhizobium leguminosarum TaxID=384 RepID=A0A2Z4YSX5_RHILE|nr:hypothetical protein DLJ82_5692 [Rhizobium leguminosarum]
MRDHPDGPTGESAIACLRLVGEPVRGTGSDGSVSNQRPPPKKQRWGKSKTVLSETAGSRVRVKQHSERCLQREERNADEDAELWRCGIAAVVLLSIVAMLSLAVFSMITKLVPTSSSCHGMACALTGAGSARRFSIIRIAVWSLVTGPHCFRRNWSAG